mmetsp:Transcript_7517/g.18079  ORF Transcript_7517/g.18079 Transcript_7517/m.18079 type:complete len:654 (+) Transcript_7517:255-2216(+)
MFRKKKDKKEGDLPDAPNISDEDDAMWFKPTSSMTSSAAAPNTALPGMGVPPPAPPAGIRMSVSPNLSSARKSPTTSRKRFSVNDLVAAINYNDWAAVKKILDQDPKVASKNAQLSLKGQTTESNPLHLMVISNPPLDLVEQMIKAFPAGASNTDRQGDRTALHWACIANASPAILEVVTHANHGSCRYQDRKFGRTPLHYLALIAEDADQVHALLEVERRAAMVKDNNQKTPIDLANESSNPAKMDIVAALQRKRSSVGVFGALKGKAKTRTASPGKYKMRSSSPGKYSGSPDDAPAVPKSPGRYRSSTRERAPKSPGKYKGSSRRSADGEREGSSRGRRSTEGEKEGSSRGRRTTGQRSSKRDSRRHRSSRTDGGLAQEAMAATQSLVVSESSDEFMLAPPMAQSQSLGPGDLRQPRSNSSFNPSRSVSPVPTNSTRSRSPIPSVSPPPIVHGSPVAAPPIVHAAPEAPPPIVHGSPVASSQGRRSNQEISAGMDGEMRALRDKLERKKRDVQTKDVEIAQMQNQIDNNKEEVAILKMQGSGAASGNDRKLSEKRDKVQRLKEKIAELQAELKKAEKDVKKLESAGSDNTSSAYAQEQIQVKEDEQSSLEFVMETLVQEKIASQREVENVESELKSLETIQMLAQADDNIG